MFILIFVKLLLLLITMVLDIREELQKHGIGSLYKLSFRSPVTSLVVGSRLKLSLLDFARSVHVQHYILHLCRQQGCSTLLAAALLTKDIIVSLNLYCNIPFLFILLHMLSNCRLSKLLQISKILDIFIKKYTNILYINAIIRLMK